MLGRRVNETGLTGTWNFLLSIAVTVSALSYLQERTPTEQFEG